MDVGSPELRKHLLRIIELALFRHENLHQLPTLPEMDELLTQARDATLLQQKLPIEGQSLTATMDEVFESILPSLTNAAGPKWFGLVTGGVTPAALLGDWLTPLYDSNLIVHLPEESIATVLEQHALDMVLDLCDLPRDRFVGKTLTTGASASNVLALAQGRQWVCATRWNIDSAEDGMCGKVVKVLGVKVHASILKAMSVVGLGRKNYIEVSQEGSILAWDLEKLEALLKEYKETDTTGAIVVASFGEVNTGAFVSDIPRVRELCDKYQAWLHIDAAFGMYARASKAYAHLSPHLELADSITSDGHKWLNVPYDCGLYYTRHLDVSLQVFGGIKAAYLETNATADSIPNPMSTNIESSRRFRALPLYMSLKTYGAEGYTKMIESNCLFAKKLADWLQQHPLYELITPCHLNIVLFRGAGERWVGRARHQELIRALKATGDIYVTATEWNGQEAIRAAISNWRTDFERDFEVVTNALEKAVQ
ncbi:PLP-dependent transferase [Basidiobolus meristosporus CBS 931.73]|uniref:PLP-dependent transferase n=1 Tax=Basidiobolus meristosporus CBS 931.73 TaxID=1314790 RepID=A0A1Y1Y0I2_9FUNG|nr:PLP-dependent transferase [Basidiobolus meristosporus CBS 931.73]|eukprot:ORX91134.1 PLP-dependent transferase [Basidiobolus meristosporus CBS 931.73]